MEIKKARFILLSLLVSVALALTGCGGKASQTGTGEKTIKIGFMGPLTGDAKTFGESTRNAFLLALEQAGMKAGDYKIEHVIADDRNDATEAVNVVDKLISQDKVQAIVGSVTSRTTIAVSEIANSKKVVLISPTATAAKVTVDNNKRKEFVFRACFLDPFQGEIAARFARESLKAQTAAILYDQGNDYSKGLAESFKSSFEALGGKIVAWEAYSKDDQDFSAVLTNIAEKNPDILYLPDYYGKVSLIGKQARGKGIKAVFLGGDGWDSPELDFAAMEGGYFTNHYSPDDPRPEVQKWIQDYKSKYGAVPDALATLAYDATNILLNAIKTANSNDPVKIKEALQATQNFPGVTGKITFNANGDPVKPAHIIQIKGGKQVYVTTVNP